MIFKPTTTGSRPGTLTVNSAGAANDGFPVTLTGNGVDFSVALTPTSGQTVAGINTSATATTSPIAGFAAPVTLSCTTNAPASTCTPASASITPSSSINTTVTITTTSQYALPGYGGLGGGPLFSLLAFGSGGLLWLRRKKSASLLRSGLLLVLLTATGLSISGCTGKDPAKNSVYTPAGSYTYTVSATDGFLTHSATYNLNVTAK